MGIPSFGFIIHENIQMEGKNCRYLLVRKDYSMCAASDKMLCPYFAEKVFCPFFDSENLPWVLKEFFMTGQNRLSAVNDLSQIDVILKAFIQKPRILNYVSKKEIRQYCQEFMKIHQRILRKGLSYKIIAIVSKNKGSLVFFEFVPDESSFSYKLTEKPINIELMKLPQTAFGGDLSKVEFGGTNVVREHNKLIIIKGDNSSRSWSLAEARNDAFKEIDAVRQILSEGREKNEK
jgi:hypothetical protein